MNLAEEAEELERVADSPPQTSMHSADSLNEAFPLVKPLGRKVATRFIGSASRN